jgi:hypothetical protein
MRNSARIGGGSATVSAQLTRATFAPHVGDTFHISLAPPDTLPITLVALNDLQVRALPAADGAAPPQGESFALVFRGPRAPQLAQGMYEFAHDQIGAFALFIVPIGADTDSVRYEAIFNRMVLAPTP